MSEWIKVSEKLPICECLGFVFGKNGIEYGILFDRTAKRFFEINSFDYDIFRDDITHWMPEPTSPEDL